MVDRIFYSQNLNIGRAVGYKYDTRRHRSLSSFDTIFTAIFYESHRLKPQYHWAQCNFRVLV